MTMFYPVLSVIVHALIPIWAVAVNWKFRANRRKFFLNALGFSVLTFFMFQWVFFGIILLFYWSGTGAGYGLGPIVFFLFPFSLVLTCLISNVLIRWRNK